MRFARTFRGILIDAESNRKHGNFVCPECHNLAHWRRESVDLRRPHFYHAVANEECPLSVIGGVWSIVGDEEVEFTSEPGGEAIAFRRVAEPNLTKIPESTLLAPTEAAISSRGIIRIRLSSLDLGHIDHAVSLFCDSLAEQKLDTFGAIPLPVHEKSIANESSAAQRVHRRLLHIEDCTPKVLERLSHLNIPEDVNVEFETRLVESGLYRQ